MAETRNQSRTFAVWIVGNRAENAVITDRGEISIAESLRAVEIAGMQTATAATIPFTGNRRQRRIFERSAECRPVTGVIGMGLDELVVQLRNFLVMVFGSPFAVAECLVDGVQSRVSLADENTVRARLFAMVEQRFLQTLHVLHRSCSFLKAV